MVRGGRSGSVGGSCRSIGGGRLRHSGANGSCRSECWTWRSIVGAGGGERWRSLVGSGRSGSVDGRWMLAGGGILWASGAAGSWRSKCLRLESVVRARRGGRSDDGCWRSGCCDGGGRKSIGSDVGGRLDAGGWKLGC